MDIERFLEMFKEESDLPPKKLLRAFLNRHIKNSTQEQITQPKVLEIRNMLWQVAIDIGNYKLLKHIIHCHHLCLNFFKPLFEFGNKELVGFFVVKFSGEKNALLYQALQTDQTDVLIWCALWDNIRFSPDLFYKKILFRSIEKLSKSNQMVHLFDVWRRQFGSKVLLEAINQIKLLCDYALYSDVESFVWLYSKTKKKPISGAHNKMSITLLNYAICNKNNSGIFKFLLDEACHNDILAEIWFLPKNLNQCVKLLFHSKSIPFSEKFSRFSILYSVVESSKLPCCKNCKQAHGQHFSMTEVFKIRFETTEQILQLLSLIKKENIKIAKTHVALIKKHIYKTPELIFTILPLIKSEDRDMVLTWLMIKPFDGCTEGQIFNTLIANYKPSRFWWEGILTPLKSIDKCPHCNKNVITCLENRVSKWLGMGGNINDVIKAAHKIQLPIKLLKRLDLIHKPIYNMRQIQIKKKTMKEINNLQSPSKKIS